MNRTECIANWYLRFNGYFTTADFTVHPDGKIGGTDADILAVRFPHSAERQKSFIFVRDRSLILDAMPDFIICEVKTGSCSLNSTWTSPEKKHVQYAIRWMGFTDSEDRIEEAARCLYTSGAYCTNELSVRFLCIGDRTSPEIDQRWPKAIQKDHLSIVRFLQERFKTGCHQIHRDNWDPMIREFATACRKISADDLVKWMKMGQ